MRALGFGIIGCGTISAWHAQAISKVENARLIGATDADLGRAQTFCQSHGGRVFASVEELLACPDIDIVNICVPSGLHANLAILAAQAGKHIVVEKPMALSVADADRVIRVCQEQGVKLEVISQIRFSPAVNRLKQAVEAGTLGRVVTGDVFMKFYRSKEYYASAGWRGTYAMDGGGALMNQGIHGIDSLLYVMGDVKQVFGYAKTLVHDIEVEDTCSAVLEFKNGAIGVIQGTTSVYPGYARRLEVSGNLGTIALEEDSIVRWDTTDDLVPDDVVLKGAEASGASDPTAISIDGHIAQMRDMADAVRQDRRPAVDGCEARRPVALICAIYESQKRGTPILLDEFFS